MLLSSKDNTTLVKPDSVGVCSCFAFDARVGLVAALAQRRLSAAAYAGLITLLPMISSASMRSCIGMALSL